MPLTLTDPQLFDYPFIYIVEPGGLETRLRSVQVHGEDVPRALPGQRTAVALHGVAPGLFQRMMTVANWLANGPGGTQTPRQE